MYNDFIDKYVCCKLKKFKYNLILNFCKTELTENVNKIL